MKEIFKDIPGYEGFYQVSDKGSVKALERTYKQFNGLTGNYNYRVYPEKLMFIEEDKDGYLKTRLSKDGSQKKFFIHRLVALTFIPNNQDKPEVNHIDGNKKNNTLANLEWVTTSENQRHAIANKLYETAKGESSGTSKLKESEVREIHKLWSTGEVTQEYLSKKFGIAGSAISRIVNGVRWRHIYNEIYGVVDER